MITPGGGTSNGTSFDQIQTSKGLHYKTNPSQDDIAVHFTDDRYEPPRIQSQIIWKVHVFAYADGNDNAYVDCDYKARVFVANIDTKGTKNYTSPIIRKLLVGQTVLPQVRPYLDTPYTPQPSQNNPAPVQSISSSPISVRWSFDQDREPFNHWVLGSSYETASIQPFSQSSLSTSTGGLVLSLDQNSPIPTMHWSYTNDSSNTLLYVAATLNIGANTQDPGANLKFKLSQLIIVKRPTANLDTDQGNPMATVQGKIYVKDMDPDANSSSIPVDNSDPNSKIIPVMQARSTSEMIPPAKVPTNKGPGMKWTGWVKEPVEFRGIPNNRTQTVEGRWCFAQLISANRTITNQLGAVKNWGYNAPSLGARFILDEAFPYASQRASNTTRVVDPDTGSASIYSQDDSPFVALVEPDPLTDPMNQQIKRYVYRDGASMNDTFEVYLMYQPPVDLTNSLASEWVPLLRLEWKTNGSVGNFLNKTDLQRWFLADPSQVMRNLIDLCDVHPIWNEIIVISSVFNKFQ